MAYSENKARKTIVSKLQRELEAEATLANQLLCNLTRYYEQIRTREIQMTMLQSMPTMSLNSYGLHALLMTHEADIRTTNNLIRARQELLRSIAANDYLEQEDEEVSSYYSEDQAFKSRANLEITAQGHQNQRDGRFKWNNKDTSTSNRYDYSLSSFGTSDDDNEADDPNIRPFIGYKDLMFQTSDEDDDSYDDDDYDDDHRDYGLYVPPLMDHRDYGPMVRNGADDPYIRPLNHYGDQIFQKYDDDDDDDDADDDNDDDQYFTPRSSTDPMDLENIDVPALMKRNDAGDPYIRPLVDYEDKIFPISDDQKYAEQLQLEEALEFSSASLPSRASTSSSSKLPIDSRKLPERYCDICTDRKTESEMF
ncbi:hypothetical protein Tco_0210229 [Tanacetum coccineum]